MWYCFFPANKADGWLTAPLMSTAHRLTSNRYKHTTAWIIPRRTSRQYHKTSKSHACVHNAGTDLSYMRDIELKEMQCWRWRSCGVCLWFMDDVDVLYTCSWSTCNLQLNWSCSRVVPRDDSINRYIHCGWCLWPCQEDHYYYCYCYYETSIII